MEAEKFILSHLITWREGVVTTTSKKDGVLMLDVSRGDNFDTTEDLSPLAPYIPVFSSSPIESQLSIAYATHY